MLIAVSLIFVLIIATLLAGIVFRQNNRFTRRRWSLLVLALLSICLGIILTGDRLYHMQDNLKRNWSNVDGEVVSSKVVGDRAFHPEICYRYSVENQEYIGSTDMDTPGFGGKRNRLETAELVVGGYPIGKTVKVYYDPADPSKSRLWVGISYRIYTQLTLGTLLLVAGLFGAIINMPKRSNQ